MGHLRLSAGAVLHLVLALAQLALGHAELNVAHLLSTNTSHGDSLKEHKYTADWPVQNHAWQRNLLQENAELQVSPRRRNPLDGFQWYNGTVQLASQNYWATSIWTGYPYMVVAAAWIFVTLLVVTVRCVCCFQGEGFYPKTYSSSMAWRWYKPTLAVCMTVALAKLAALTAFAVYASLAYMEGKQFSKTLTQEYGNLASVVEAQSKTSQTLQSLIDGDLRVAGRMYSSAFVGDVPTMLPPAQAVLNDMDRVRTEITGDRKFVADAYESLIALVLLCCSSGLIILFLVSFASICQSKTVLNYSAVALPVSGLVIWCTVAVVYGTWIVAHDVCDVADAYEAAAVGSELHAAAEQIVFPCPNTTAAAILSYNSKKTMLGLSNAVNQLVTDQYNLPVMSNFTDEPLLCEAYALEPNQSYTAVVCPYPTTQHRLTAATWEANSIGIRCFGNNNDLCAAGATPITQDVFMSVLQLLVHVEAAESVRLSADAVSGCTFARDTVANVANRHCRRDDLRGLLFTAWVALLVAGGAGVTLLPLVLLLQRMMAPTGIAAVEAVYNPGYSLPLKTLAAGWREEDYTPGAASQVVRKNSFRGTVAVPESPKLNEFFMPAHAEQLESPEA